MITTTQRTNETWRNNNLMNTMTQVKGQKIRVVPWCNINEWQKLDRELFVSSFQADASTWKKIPKQVSLAWINYPAGNFHELRYIHLWHINLIHLRTPYTSVNLGLFDISDGFRNTQKQMIITYRVEKLPTTVMSDEIGTNTRKNRISGDTVFEI